MMRQSSMSARKSSEAPSQISLVKTCEHRHIGLSPCVSAPRSLFSDPWQWRGYDGKRGSEKAVECGLTATLTAM